MRTALLRLPDLVALRAAVMAAPSAGLVAAGAARSSPRRRPQGKAPAAKN